MTEADVPPRSTSAILRTLRSGSVLPRPVRARAEMFEAFGPPDLLEVPRSIGSITGGYSNRSGTCRRQYEARYYQQGL
jgi:hypothetical protein